MGGEKNAIPAIVSSSPNSYSHSVGTICFLWSVNKGEELHMDKNGTLEEQLEPGYRM